MKDILPKNTKGQLHGYCERYWSNGQLIHKGVYWNGKGYGYFEGRQDLTGYFIDDVNLSDCNEKGYCYIWDKKEYIIGTTIQGHIIVVE